MAITAKKGPLKFLKFLLLLILILFPFGQLTRIPLGIADVHVYVQDILLTGLWFTLIIYFIQKKTSPLNFPLFKPVSLFVLAAVFSLVSNSGKLSLGQLAVSSLYLLRWIAFTGIFFSNLIFVKDSENSAKFIYKGLILAGLLTAVLGILQYVFYPNLRNLYYLGWDPHYLRIFGAFFDPAFIGLIFVLALDLIYFKNSQKINLYEISAGFIIFIALALTYSRSSYLAFIISFLSLTWFTKKWKFMTVLVLISIFILFLLPSSSLSEGVQLGRTSTINARSASWQKSFVSITKSPLFGLGFDTLRYTAPQTQLDYVYNQPIENHSAAGVENSFLFIIATTGIIGFSAYVFLLYEIFIPGDPLIKASFLGVIIHSLFNNSLFYPWIMLWLWFIVALAS